MNGNSDAIEVREQPLRSVLELAAEWRDLEARARPNFFLSWYWIGAWLNSLPLSARPQRVLRATQGGRVVGLALLAEQVLRWRWLPLARAVYVNEAGNPAFDSASIEHNGLLVDAGNADGIMRAMLEHLVGVAGCADRLRIGAMHGAPGDLPFARAGRLRQSCDELVCRTTNLAGMRAAGLDFPPSTSARRRLHLRRSLREYGKLGEVRLECAADVTTAVDWLQRLLLLHVRRRTSLGDVSNFNLPFVRRFHERLIRSSFDAGAIQMLRITAGAEEVGYLYCFVHHGRVSFQQSGFNYELLGGKFSPGMVSLLLALRYNAGLGHEVFDFLAGDGQYKQALATDHECLYGVTVERDGWVYRCLQLRRWWRRSRLPQLRARTVPAMVATTETLSEFAWQLQPACLL